MPPNLYTFLIGSKLVESEFEDKNVPNKDRATQLGLVAALFSPSDGGGLGSSLMPAVLIQQIARREAEAAAEEAKKKAALQLASATANQFAASASLTPQASDVSTSPTGPTGIANTTGVTGPTGTTGTTRPSYDYDRERRYGTAGPTGVSGPTGATAGAGTG